MNYIELRQALDRLMGPTNKMREAIPHARYRPEQYKMAHAVLRIVNNSSGEAKVIEAPTGSGKSMALLIPACITADNAKKEAAQKREQSTKRIILTTGSKALQNQLTFKDVPAIQKLFPEVKVALLQGRDNYISPPLLNDINLVAFENNTDKKIAGYIAEHLPQIFERLEKGEGTIEELKGWWKEQGGEIPLPPRILQKITAPPKENMGMESFHQKALLRANQADIIVMNHALLTARSQFSESLWPAPNPNYCGIGETKIITKAKPDLLIDEAHQLPNVVLEQQRIVTSSREWEEWAELALAKGDPAEYKDAQRLIHDLNKQWEQTEPTQDGFAPQAGHVQLFKRSVRLMELLTDSLKEAASYGYSNAAEKIPKAEQTKKLFEDMIVINDTPKNFHNVWRNRKGIICFEGKPFDIRTNLADTFEMGKSCILTSATATFGSDAHTRQAYGLDVYDARRAERGISGESGVIRLPSPFKIREVTKAFVLRGIPTNDTGIDAFAKSCKPLIDALKGRTMLIFCSYDAMNKAAEKLQPCIEANGAQMLVQGRGCSAHQMAALLRKDPRHVLLGTESLRTGIDIPGDHLAAVVIHKLPFAIPDRYADERSKYVKREWGLDYFRDIVVPNTANQLQQAVGRLIRTPQDRGILVVADERIITARYARELDGVTGQYDWNQVYTPEQMPPAHWIQKECLKTSKERIR